jgi:hypothetical protein
MLLKTVHIFLVEMQKMKRAYIVLKIGRRISATIDTWSKLMLEVIKA